MSRGFYEQLGVESSASTGQIRAAYGRAVAEWVQKRKRLIDRGDGIGGLDRVRQELDEAWSVLSDPRRRRRYDAMCQWLAEPGNASDPEGFWHQVADSLVHPAAAAAARLLRATTHLKEIGPVTVSASALEDLPPTLVPRDEDHTSPGPAQLAPTSSNRDAVSDPGAAVVPLPTATTESPSPALRLVDGSPAASSVIVLPTDAPRHRTLSTEDIARLVDDHGYSGSLLRSVREARGMGLQEMADTTRISAQYLEAIEEDQHEALPSQTFVRGYVREMARLLKLDDQQVVDGYMLRLE